MIIEPKITECLECSKCHTEQVVVWSKDLTAKRQDKPVGKCSFCKTGNLNHKWVKFDPGARSQTLSHAKLSVQGKNKIKNAKKGEHGKKL